MRTNATPRVRLRDDIGIEDPLRVVVGYLEAWRFEAGDTSASFAEPDLRLANRGGARISAAEIPAVLERRAAIEGALRAVAPEDSLAGSASSVPWLPLRHLFDAFADIRALRAVRRELARRGNDLTEVRILDLLIWSAQTPPEGATAADRS